MHDVHNIGKLNSSTGLKEIHAFIEHIYQLQFLCSWLWRCDLTESPLKKTTKTPQKTTKTKTKNNKNPPKTNKPKKEHTHSRSTHEQKLLRDITVLFILSFMDF